jgi:hemerythrin-like metal-binding protein
MSNHQVDEQASFPSPEDTVAIESRRKFLPLWVDARHTLGVAEIDDAHRDFINRVAILIASSDADFPALFQALVAHTREHFMAEGRMMRETKYPGLGVHEGEHHRVLGELQQLNRSLKRGRLPLVRAYVREGLPEWFDTHLTMMDGALVAFLKKQSSTEISH